jgi:hypothetical protein
MNNEFPNAIPYNENQQPVSVEFSDDLLPGFSLDLAVNLKLIN